jgi:hypothetical protein
MARALLGYVGSSNSTTEQVLALEVARLRRRVAELETEVGELRSGRPDELVLELHRIAQDATPALA